MCALVPHEYVRQQQQQSVHPSFLPEGAGIVRFSGGGEAARERRAEIEFGGRDLKPAARIRVCMVSERGLNPSPVDFTRSLGARERERDKMD